MWFKKKDNKLPIVIFNGITAVVEKDWSDFSWKFTYKEMDFHTEDHILNIPSTETLDNYVSWINNNKNKINESIAVNMKHWDGANIDSANIGGITILDTNKISVLYIGDETWGDMGGDFIIENGVITDEGWGD